MVAPPRPLSAGDDHNSFNCDRESLNAWLRRHALSNHLTGASRVSVLAEGAQIIGFVALSAGQIERSFVAKAMQRNQPDPLPVTLLGRLAVDVRFQGRGHARTLLVYALRAALAASRRVGSFGVLTHPIDEDVRAFYAHWGFRELPFDPLRAMFVRMVDLERTLKPEA